MTDKLTIIGAPISPYVRKVLAILIMKDLPFRCIPQVPFLADDNFTRISPLRRIPVLKHGDFTLPDSTAIIQYLEEAFPDTPAAYPGDAKARARARWFEEYADDHFGRNVIFNLFFQRVVRPRVLKQEPDQALIDQTLESTLPNALDYLEGEVPADGFLAGDISVGDITIAAMMKNAFWAGWEMDEDRWPGFAAWLKRTSDHPALMKVNTLADEMMAVPPTEHEAIMERFHAAA
ncbi:glutathione S-transferase family protein [Kordiimonas lacus]|uniref:Glutathione S-transferase n=1 Tax=Kordiimonas lacus TaxID=637679 RepID=A0A1G7A1P9_9PROT|nr:glutathione S-transferase family protein [Kordiimonas lacus]SDE07816.1 Glutathione S-transferase [Kordiimonas lacus]